MSCARYLAEGMQRDSQPHSMVMDTTSGRRPAVGGAGPAADARKVASM